MNFLDNLSAIKRHYADAPLGTFQRMTKSMIPTTPEDVGMAVMSGPFGRIGKLGGLALAGIGYAPQADAASGGLSKLAGLISPRLGAIQEEATAFGKQFPRHSDDGPGDAARHAYASSRVAREYGPNAAKFLGWLNEAAGIGADRRAVRMDDANNAAGLSLADLDDLAARKRIEEMIRLRQLQWMNNSSNPNAGYAVGGMVHSSGKKGRCGCSCDTCAKRGTCERAK